MPTVTLNGLAYNATLSAAYTTPSTSRRAPQSITMSLRAPGEVVTAVNGAEIVVWRETSAGSTTPRREWLLEWERVPEGTRAAVENVARLRTTFTAILPSGTYTVQCDPDAYEETPDVTLPNGTIYYNLSLTVREA